MDTTVENKVKLNRMGNCLYVLHEIGTRKGESVFSNKFWSGVQHDHANGVTKEEAEHFINLVQTAVNSHYDLLEALQKAMARIRFLENYTEGKVDITDLTHYETLISKSN